MVIQEAGHVSRSECLRLFSGQFTWMAQSIFISSKTEENRSVRSAAS